MDGLLALKACLLPSKLGTNLYKIRVYGEGGSDRIGPDTAPQNAFFDRSKWDIVTGGSDPPTSPKLP